MFTISKIRFDKDCMGLKNLKTDVDYFFEHQVHEDFYAKNICISAIVGKNGAGKSSLLDMILRVINNLSYCFYINHPIHKDKRQASNSEPMYVLGIRATLTFKVDTMTGSINIDDNIVVVEFGSKKCHFLVYNFPNSPVKYLNIPNFNELSSEEQREISNLFFYTICSNYSLQSFISEDYKYEKCLRNITDPGFSKSWYITSSNESWIDPLFHRNDGYSYPIVLIPYRNKGIIDMTKEEQLTISRLSALLIEEKEGETILDDYCYDTMSLTYYPRTLRDKFSTITEPHRKLFNTEEEVEEHNILFTDKWKYDENEDIKEFKTISQEKYSYAYVILSTLGCAVDNDMDLLQIYSRMYLVYKVLSIAEKYPNYQKYYKKFGNIDYTFGPIADNNEFIVQELISLTTAVQNDNSHIGLKFRQALNFVLHYKKCDAPSFEDPITYEDFAKILNYPAKGISIQQRMEYLPPSFFHQRILLKNKMSQKSLELNQLSSGERQFVFQVSALLYHIMNLISIPNDGSRIRYTNLNLILDEIEICFHPEYQRTFIKKLRDLFVRFNINKHFDINIILTTHSPFLLSDIPRCNILALDNGVPTHMNNNDRSIMKETFCSNVYDILKDHFFMNNFVGEIALEKVNEIIVKIKKLEKENGALSDEEFAFLKSQIDVIGDKFIRLNLNERLSRLRYTDPLMAEYKALENRMLELKSKMNKNDTDTL